MSDDRDVELRWLSKGDAEDVLGAFESNEDMAMQGSVATLSDAERYIANLLAPESSHRPWAISDQDRLVGLACVSVDEQNLNG